MAATVSVFLFQEDASGNPTFNKSVDVADLTVKQDGVLMSPQPTITNNGDGSYQFDITESGKYTLLLNSVEQDELKNVYICADDNLSQQDLAGTPARGKIQLTGGELIVYTDGSSTILISADIINDLVTGGTTVPLSAEQGKELQDNKVEISDIINNLTSTETDQPLSAYQGKILKDAITLNFADPTFINDSYTISQNFERLDNAIVQGIASSQGLKWVILAAQQSTMATSETDATALPNPEILYNTTKIVIRAVWKKEAGDQSLMAFCRAEDVGDAGGYVNLVLFIDGTQVDYVQESLDDDTWHDVELIKTISTYPAGIYEVHASIQVANNASMEVYVKHFGLAVQR